MLVSFALRSGLAIGAVYYARELGIWGNSQQTEKLYNNLKEYACPQLKKITKDLPIEMPSLPNTGEVRFLVKHYYNMGVKGTFNFIQMMPCYAGQLVMKTKNTLNNALETPPSKN